MKNPIATTKTYIVEIGQRKLNFRETFTIQAETPLQAQVAAMKQCSDLPDGFTCKVRRAR